MKYINIDPRLVNRFSDDSKNFYKVTYHRKGFPKDKETEITKDYSISAVVDTYRDMGYVVDKIKKVIVKEE